MVAIFGPLNGSKDQLLRKPSSLIWNPQVKGPPGILKLLFSEPVEREPCIYFPGLLTQNSLLENPAPDIAPPSQDQPAQDPRVMFVGL